MHAKILLALGGVGGGQYSIIRKLFLISIYFIVKNDCLNPKFKLDSLAIKNKK